MLMEMALNYYLYLLMVHVITLIKIILFCWYLCVHYLFCGNIFKQSLSRCVWQNRRGVSLRKINLYWRLTFCTNLFIVFSIYAWSHTYFFSLYLLEQWALFYFQRSALLVNLSIPIEVEMNSFPHTRLTTDEHF